MEVSKCAFKNFLKSNDLYNSHNFKTSFCADHPFPRLKVKLKNEIVSLGNELADPAKIVGEYVQPEDWNKLISQDDVLVLDTRNNYEVEVGTFKKAVNPKCTNFTDILNWLDENIINNTNYQYKKIAMF